MAYRFGDFYPGQTFTTAWGSVSEKEIVDFSHQFDPQLFHLGKDPRPFTLFDSVIASGWHSCAACQKLIVDCLLKDATCLAATRIDNLLFLAPLYPDTRFRVSILVIDTEDYPKLPDTGMVMFENRMETEDGSTILKMNVNVLFAK